MKRLLSIMLLVACTTTVKSMAQKAEPKQNSQQPVQIELPADQVIRHFRRDNPGTVEVKWYTLEDEKNRYTYGDYEINGDIKRVYYRNDAYYCTQTQIPLEYCPAKIKAAVDTLAQGYKMVDLYYQRTLRGNAYRAVMQKGKRKKAQYRDLLFSIKGDFMKETETDKIIRGL